MIAELVPFDVLKSVAESNRSANERHAALYWMQRMLVPEAVDYVLHHHHISASDRIVFRVTAIYDAIRCYGVSPNPELMARCKECGVLIKQFCFATSWLPHEDWVVGAARYGYPDSQNYWDAFHSLNPVYMNLSWGASEDELLSKMDSVAKRRSACLSSDARCTSQTVASCLDLFGHYSITVLEGALQRLQGKDGIAVDLLQAEVERRRTHLLRDAWLITEDEDEIQRRVAALYAIRPSERLGAALALSGVGDVRALQLLNDEEVHFVHPRVLPAAWSYMADWLA